MACIFTTQTTLRENTATIASGDYSTPVSQRTLLKHVQQNVVAEQVAGYVAQASTCPCCGCRYSVKENRNLVYRTLFGKLKLNSPRFYSACQCDDQRIPGKSFSPLADVQRTKFRTNV
jgi:hypothetical protein